jgi:hypothetical protein
MVQSNTHGGCTQHDLTHLTRHADTKHSQNRSCVLRLRARVGISLFPLHPQHILVTNKTNRTNKTNKTNKQHNSTINTKDMRCSTINCIILIIIFSPQMFYICISMGELLRVSPFFLQCIKQNWESLCSTIST